MIAFVIGAIYFGYKAHSLNEKWGFYAIVGGIVTAILSFLIGLFVGFGLAGLGITGTEVALIFSILVSALSVYLLDTMSGLYWNAEKHATEKAKEAGKLSADELATIRSLQIQKGEGSLEELQAYEATLSVENSEESDVEKLELTQNSLPGEIDYIVIPDTIKKMLPKDEEGLIKCIAEYKKYVEEEWTESIPMYAAVELDKTGIVFTPENLKSLDDYAKSLKVKNFVELVSMHIPK